MRFNDEWSPAAESIRKHIEHTTQGGDNTRKRLQNVSRESEKGVGAVSEKQNNNYAVLRGFFVCVQGFSEHTHSDPFQSQREQQRDRTWISATSTSSKFIIFGLSLSSRTAGDKRANDSATVRHCADLTRVCVRA